MTSIVLAFVLAGVSGLFREVLLREASKENLTPLLLTFLLLISAENGPFY